MPNRDDLLGQTEPARPHQGRRRFVRYPIVMPVTAQAAQFPGRGLHGTIRDIGRGGLMAEFPVALVPGSVVELTIRTQGGFLRETSRVVWVKTVEGRARHGFAFPEPKPREYAVDLYRQEYPGDPEVTGGRLNDEGTERD
jgi:PilZ domain